MSIGIGSVADDRQLRQTLDALLFIGFAVIEHSPLTLIEGLTIGLALHPLSPCFALAIADDVACLDFAVLLTDWSGTKIAFGCQFAHSIPLSL
jgi:hypothetical protein